MAAGVLLARSARKRELGGFVLMMRGLFQLLWGHFAALVGSILVAALAHPDDRSTAVVLIWFAGVCIAIRLWRNRVVTSRATSQKPSAVPRQRPLGIPAPGPETTYTDQAAKVRSRTDCGDHLAA